MSKAEPSADGLKLSFEVSVSFRSARTTLRTVYPWLDCFQFGPAGVFILLGALTGDAFPIFIGVITIVLLEIVLRVALRPYRGEPFDEVWSITENDVRVELRDRSIVYRWEACAGVRERRGLWVLRFSGLTGVGFPTGALCEAESEAFMAFLRSRSLLLR